MLLSSTPQPKIMYLKLQKYTNICC